MHNVNTAFSELKRHGVVIPQDINAHHIVDAHREVVLKLMWLVVAHMCLSKLLCGGHVEEEIQNVLQSNQARRKVHGQIASALELLSPSKPEEGATSSSEQAGLEKNTYHYNAMISVAEKSKNLRHALDLLKEMDQRGIAKNEVT